MRMSAVFVVARRSDFEGVRSTVTSDFTAGVKRSSLITWIDVSCQNWTWSLTLSTFFGSTGAESFSTAFGPYDGSLTATTASWRSFTRLIDFAFDTWNLEKQFQSASFTFWSESFFDSASPF